MSTKTTIKVYGATTLFCLVFNYVYSLFGHGVSSPFMSYAFVFSLVLGVGGFSVFKRLRLENRVAFQLYNAGISTLTVGSLLQGIIDIAGADATHSTYYFIIGTVLVIIGGLLVLVPWIRTQKIEG